MKLIYLLKDLALSIITILMVMSLSGNIAIAQQRTRVVFGMK